ncbi:AhpC/TSA family protein [Prevotella cerevisiae]|uniref:AhpC/TSA family protein n=1 Tax=Segatella cerevisiae TaxID=2053716 RepID=A0ABT1BY76_9BACT|nr:TlpA disulfide reductase family protein [Segatella cerevisiae]MCO6026032.1 AhpC/TSA family protein [Segatella cerevisiae]
MKHLMILILSVVGLLLPASAFADTYHIDGQLADKASHKIYLSRYTDKAFVIQDSAIVKDGSFSFSGTLSTPLLYGLSTERNSSSPQTFFLENSPVKVSLDEQNATIRVSGSQTDSLYRKELPDVEKKGYRLDSLIAVHPKSVVPAYFLIHNFAWSLDLHQLQVLRSAFSSELDRTLYLKQIDTLIISLKKVDIGQRAPDFTLRDVQNRKVSLSDFRGKYVLVEFWASWCGDCRREMPIIKTIHAKYKDLAILGVSFDRNRPSWLNAIRQYQLGWTQVSDLKGWGSRLTSLYAVRWIPTAYLISPEGKILYKALTMSGLDQVLESYLKP